MTERRQGCYLLLLVLWALANPASAGKLAIVIDDFGYRPSTEKQILALPEPVSVSVLPNATFARQMAIKAHELGHEVLIHMPMAPLSPQPLEKDTLFPTMSGEEIQQIIRDAESKVPYAVGMNNHMGSAMTSSLPAMRKVMQAIRGQNLFFLDSRTISSSQVRQAAAGTGVQVIQRDVFLDDVRREKDIHQQMNRAIALARRNGSAIAIGHPYPETVRVLRQRIPQLPADITLVPVIRLLSEHHLPAENRQPGVCPLPQPLPVVPDSRFFILIWQSVSDFRRDLQKN